MGREVSEREIDAADRAVELHLDRTRKDPVTGTKKQRRIESFVKGSFSVYDRSTPEDWADENFGVELMDFESDTVYDALCDELERASDHLGEELDASTVAFSLLGSGDDALACNLADVSLSDLTLERVLGHVYCLGYKFSSRMLWTIARRTFLVLLNRRWFGVERKFEEEVEGA